MSFGNWPKKIVTLFSFFTNEVVGVFGQTELLHDAVAECILKKKKPIFIQKPHLLSSVVTPDFTAAEAIISAVCQPLEHHFSIISQEYLVDRALEIFKKRLATELGQYNFALDYWQKQIASFPQLKLMLSGYSSGPQAMAMANCCTKGWDKDCSFSARHHQRTTLKC